MIDCVDTHHDFWTQFVHQHPNATVFHHASWSALLSECYGYQPFIIVLRSEKDGILAGLPMMEINSWVTGKRWVALPFTDHCSPLLKNGKDLKLFIGQLMAKANEPGNPRMEIRYGLHLAGNSIQKDSYFIHTLKLNRDPQELFKRFRKKGVRYCVKKAAKSGIEVAESTQLEALMTFYKLHSKTRRKLGVPTQPRKYFHKLWEHIINRQMGFTMLAEYEGNAIAGGVFLHYNKKLIYKYGATDPDYLNLYANHALLWEAIKWGCRNGFHLLDWGRTDKENEGLRKFKLGWGTDEDVLNYSYIGHAPNSYSAGWKQKLVENTIRKSPVWVGRLLGEALYKHVG